MSKILSKGDGSSSMHPVLVTGEVTLRIALLQRQMPLHAHMSDSALWLQDTPPGGVAGCLFPWLLPCCLATDGCVPAPKATAPIREHLFI